jgi:integrase
VIPIVNVHLRPYFGKLSLGEITVEEIERYIAKKMAGGLSARSVNSHLRVLNLTLKSAVKRRLISTSPLGLVDRPREREKAWRILSPVEIAAVERAFGELIEESEDEMKRENLTVARAIFIIVMGCGLRRGEVLGLRWHHVHLADPDGAYLRVERTFVRGADDTPKSEAGRRTIALGEKVAGVLFDHRAWSAYDGDDERVFCNPRSGQPFDVGVFGKLYRETLKKAEITDYVRPFHDGRHSSISNAAAAGTDPMALKTRSGHSSFSTTQKYIHLAGETFRAEAELLERRLWGSTKVEDEEDAVAE